MVYVRCVYVCKLLIVWVCKFGCITVTLIFYYCPVLHLVKCEKYKSRLVPKSKYQELRPDTPRGPCAKCKESRHPPRYWHYKQAHKGRHDALVSNLRSLGIVMSTFVSSFIHWWRFQHTLGIKTITPSTLLCSKLHLRWGHSNTHSWYQP